MNENPTYDELLSANNLLRQKLEWLEGMFSSNRDEGLLVKSKFLSNINHEIRTPMNAILGFSDLLKNEELPIHEREEYVQYISHNSQTLLNVMDTIMDLTLLETDNLKIRQEEVKVKELFREIYGFYSSRVVRMMHYKVALLMSIRSEYEDVVVRADGFRLSRILDNLVNTAIINQKRGVIEMKMEVRNNTIVRFSIISKQNELLTERAKMIFENIDTTDDWYNHMDATGLAYKLARDLTSAMDGTVSLEKVEDDRMSICIDLPVNNTSIGGYKFEGKAEKLLD
ncbi:sensor histidine kinase [Bacteroidota bacterium]